MNNSPFLIFTEEDQNYSIGYLSYGWNIFMIFLSFFGIIINLYFGITYLRRIIEINKGTSQNKVNVSSIEKILCIISIIETFISIGWLINSLFMYSEYQQNEKNISLCKSLGLFETFFYLFDWMILSCSLYQIKQIVVNPLQLLRPDSLLKKYVICSACVSLIFVILCLVLNITGTSPMLTCFIDISEIKNGNNLVIKNIMFWIFFISPIILFGFGLYSIYIMTKSNNYKNDKKNKKFFLNYIAYILIYIIMAFLLITLYLINYIYNNPQNFMIFYIQLVTILSCSTPLFVGIFRLIKTNLLSKLKCGNSENDELNINLLDNNKKIGEFNEFEQDLLRKIIIKYYIGISFTLGKAKFSCFEEEEDNTYINNIKTNNETNIDKVKNNEKNENKNTEGNIDEKKEDNINEKDINNIKEDKDEIVEEKNDKKEENKKDEEEEEKEVNNNNGESKDENKEKNKEDNNELLNDNKNVEKEEEEEYAKNEEEKKSEIKNDEKDIEINNKKQEDDIENNKRNISEEILNINENINNKENQDNLNTQKISDEDLEYIKINPINSLKNNNNLNEDNLNSLSNGNINLSDEITVYNITKNEILKDLDLSLNEDIVVLKQTNIDIKITEYCSQLFKKIREVDGISEDYIINLFQPKLSNNNLIQTYHKNLFYINSTNKEFLIKLISKEEINFYRSNIINNIYQYFKLNKNSIILRIQGLYDILNDDSGKIKKKYFAVMHNVYESLNNSKKQEINESFSFKNNHVDKLNNKKGIKTHKLKKYEFDNSICVETLDNNNIQNLSVDLSNIKQNNTYKIYLDKKEFQKLKNITKRDTKFLKKIGVLHYSFLVVEIPMKIKDIENIFNEDENGKNQKKKNNEMQQIKKYLFRSYLNKNIIYSISIVDYYKDPIKL